MAYGEDFYSMWAYALMVRAMKSNPVDLQSFIVALEETEDNIYDPPIAFGHYEQLDVDVGFEQFSDDLAKKRERGTAREQLVEQLRLKPATALLSFRGLVLKCVDPDHKFIRFLDFLASDARH